MSRKKRKQVLEMSSSTQRNLISCIQDFKKAKILVLGDFILDQFIWGSVDRISPEAPVPVVHVNNEDYMLGGSLNVAKNIHDLGGGVLPCGVLGRDREGRMLKKVIQQAGINTGGVVYESDRPTTIKTRIIAHSQQVVRFDRENPSSISKTCQKSILNFLKKTIKSVDVVIVEDYGKGVIEPDFLKSVIRVAKVAKKPILVDPKEKNFSYYSGVTVITPNRKEALGGADYLRIKHHGDVKKAGKGLVKKLKCDAVLMTLGEDGMAIFEKNEKVTQIPTTAQEVYDVSGAGDTVIAVLALALAAKAKINHAAMLANLAAGIVVGKLGTATITTQELKQAVNSQKVKK